jgi:hypothetical protein
MADLDAPPRKAFSSAAKQPGNMRVGLIVGGLAIALVVGFALGKAMTSAPVSGSGVPSGVTATFNEALPHTHAPMPGMAGMSNTDVGGLAISAAGYTMQPVQTAYKAGEQTFTFVIAGPDGKPFTNFAIVHDKPMHMVVARRDLSGYQHVHPAMAPNGTWTVKIKLDKPGPWRAVADFTANDANSGPLAVALGTDLTVAGAYEPVAVPAAAQEATVDGYTVRYEGTLQIGATAPLLFRVFQDGRPVPNLDPYLGSYGHLVFLRQLDLAYVHTHPEAALAGGAVKFWATAPSTGTYRMFFDFQVNGQVHSAAYTLNIGN